MDYVNVSLIDLSANYLLASGTSEQVPSVAAGPACQLPKRIGVRIRATALALQCELGLGGIFRSHVYSPPSRHRSNTVFWLKLGRDSASKTPLPWVAERKRSGHLRPSS